MSHNDIYIGDSLNVLKSMPSCSVNCIITSPPYYGLRDYGMNEQMGMEPTPESYIRKMVKVFRECRRVLRDDGTLWLNIGDSYSHNGAAYGSEKSTLVGRKQGTEMGAEKRFVKKGKGLKPKDLIGIPWMLAFALRKDGWYLRQDIIWSKPNPMPESVTDRPTKAHEYIFLLSKSSTYYYDHKAIRTKPAASTLQRLSQDIEKQVGSDRVPGKTNGNMKAVGCADKQRGHSRKHVGFNERWDNMTTDEQRSMGANKRSVWEVPTMPFQEAHFATFPEKLIIDCVKAGCMPGGVILDPFAGACTTLLVAAKNNRNAVGIELNPKYVDIAINRLGNELGMFNSLSIYQL